MRARLCAGCQFRDDRTGVSDRVGQRSVFRRVDDVRTGSEDRDGRPVTLQRAAVGGRVHTSGQPAHDRDAAAGKSRRQDGGRFEAVGGRAARADEGHRRLREHCAIAPHPENDGRIRNEGQQRWICRIAQGDGRDTGEARPVQGGGRIVAQPGEKRLRRRVAGGLDCRRQGEWRKVRGGAAIEVGTNEAGEAAAMALRPERQCDGVGQRQHGHPLERRGRIPPACGRIGRGVAARKTKGRARHRLTAAAPDLECNIGRRRPARKSAFRPTCPRFRTLPTPHALGRSVFAAIRTILRGTLFAQLSWDTFPAGLPAPD